MKRLYLDIDGVLLTTKQARPASNVLEFIDFVTSNFDCYWLTTHCKGNNQTVLKYLSEYFDKEILKKFETIKATNWTTLKTEAIDFNSDFIWLEDFPFQSEINILENKSKKDKLLIVDLNKSDELMRLIFVLDELISANTQ
jgi:hypothetical protein